MEIQKNKNALITGGSRGIGRAIAEQLVKDNFRVIIASRSKNDLMSTVDELSAFGRVEYRVLDVSNRKDIQRFADQWHEPIDVLVNNAGVCKTELLTEAADVWDEVLRTNLEGPYFLTKYLLRHIVDQGRIITVASQLGVEGRAGYSAYAASKFGLIGLTKCWAKELGARGITVNAVCPGWVKTDMAMNDLARMAKINGQSPEELYAEICQPLELKRFTEPAEVAALVAFLASPAASGITGRDWLLNTVWNQK